MMNMTKATASLQRFEEVDQRITTCFGTVSAVAVVIYTTQLSLLDVHPDAVRQVAENVASNLQGRMI